MWATRTFLLLVSVLLLGYLFLGKGFAYFGLPPLYVGEIVLAAGLLAMFLGGASFSVLNSPIAVLIVVLAAWGVVTTIPMVPTYGLMALRDSVIWSYSIFALLVASVLLRTGVVEKPIDWYGRWLPWFLLWAPIGFLITLFFAEALPKAPGTNFPVMYLKGGDLGVHLGGLLAFLALGLHRWFPAKSPLLGRSNDLIYWMLLAIGILIVGSRVRSGLVAILASMFLLSLVKPGNRAIKLLVPALAIFVMLVVTDVSIPTPSGRPIAFGQLYDNILSIVEPGSNRSLSGTAEWRLEWWQTIIDYTVFGDYFWTGKGYGVNLALDDGFWVGNQFNLNRNPHNATMVILARSGVPGAVFWLALQFVIFYSLITRYFAARRAGYDVLANVNLWLLSYWAAFNMNSSFDVFLEGPQGGIWFWCLVGYIIALTLWQDTFLRSRTSRAPLSADFAARSAQPKIAE